VRSSADLLSIEVVSADHFLPNASIRVLPTSVQCCCGKFWCSMEDEMVSRAEGLTRHLIWASS